MNARTWKRLDPATAEAVRAFLRRLGTEDEKVIGPREAWRVRVEGAVFTAYTTGTLHFTGGKGTLLDHALQEVSRIIGAAKEPPPGRS